MIYSIFTLDWLTEEDFEAVLDFQIEDRQVTGVVPEAGHAHTDNSGHAEVSSEPVAGQVSWESAAVEAQSDPLAVEASSDSVPVEASSGSVAVEAEPGPSQPQAVHRKRTRDGLMKQAELIVSEAQPNH